MRRTVGLRHELVVLLLATLAVQCVESDDGGGSAAGASGVATTAGQPAQAGSTAQGGSAMTSGGTSASGGSATGGSQGGSLGSGGTPGGAPSAGAGVVGGTGTVGGGGTGVVGGAGADAGGSGGVGKGGADSGAGGGGAGSAGAPGSGGTAGAGGQQGLPPGVSAMFPGSNASGVCTDPALRITFPSPPTLGNNGQVQVFDTAQPGNAVASVDFADDTFDITVSSQMFTMERPAYVDGNTAVIVLRSGALDYGRTYYVTVDSGAIAPSGGGSFAIDDQTTWRFSTAPAAPASLAALAVATDESGQFCSLQGALDALPDNNTAASTITIRPGNYYGVVYLNNKDNVTLHGEDRKQTILLGTNNNNMNGSTRGRALIGVDSSSGLIVENLTIHNLTPQGGSQAEALRLGDCDQCVVRDADILSLQDTLLWGGRVYAENCYIAGNVDFIWGSGAVFFQDCEIKTVGREGYNVQSRNTADGYGYVFVDSRITSDPGITGNVLARIDVSEYPNSHVAYIDCELGSHISAAGWVVTGGSPTSALRFWEYQSRNPNGDLINTSGRLAGLTPITANQAEMMRDPTVVLDGWQPPD